MKAVAQTLNKYVALLLVFALFSLSIQKNFAAPLLSLTAAPQVVGKLSTRGNRPIVVNGNNTEPGASILDGASIETPDGTGATISLGSLGEIDLAPNTVAEIHYSNGQVKVVLKRGCAIVRSKQGTTGSIETPDGTNIPVDQPDGNGKKADVCFPVGATTPVVNAGAAANAGAGAGGGAASSAAGGAAAGGGGGGLSTAAIAAIVAGGIIGVIIIVVATGEENASNSTTLING